MKRVSWLDSCDMPSHIHATEDGVETVCGGHAEFIRDRKLARSPKRSWGGRSNYCRTCFKNLKKSIPWDIRCKELI